MDRGNRIPANGRPWDFIYLMVNGAFERLTGLKNVVGKHVTEVIPGIREADPKLLEIYGQVASTGKPERFEIYVSALEMWFSISVYCPRKECFVAVFDVITERRQAEQRLRASEERFRALVENSSDGIILLDRDGRVFYASPAVTRILGYDVDEVVGLDAFNLIHPDDFDYAREHFNAVSAVENQTPFFRIKHHRLLQLMKKSGNLDKRPLCGFTFRDMPGVLPVIMV